MTLCEGNHHIFNDSPICDCGIRYRDKKIRGRKIVIEEIEFPVTIESLFYKKYVAKLEDILMKVKRQHTGDPTCDICQNIMELEKDYVPAIYRKFQRKKN